MKIYCCQCQTTEEAALLGGKDIYPHLDKLWGKRFWVCLKCRNYVGTHRTNAMPLGCIPTPELRKARAHIHAIIDPLWRNGVMKRREIYQRLSDSLGYEYHTGDIRSLEEARKVYVLARDLAQACEEVKP